MVARVQWTETMDARLRDLRHSGMTWDAIAADMKLGRNTVLERGRKIGARRPPPGPRPVLEDPERPPRCPGHPETWSLLTRGTPLEGAPYPYPVFL